jgi:bacterioferritin (cytochrome b1)
MASLNDLLRAELTAVNQQFIHVLALNRHGYAETADRIYAVDKIDFPNAMRIIDHLVVSGQALQLPLELPKPGFPMTGLLQAELQIEARMRNLLTHADVADHAAQRLFDEAAGPRPAYQAWLTTMRADSRDMPVARGYSAIDPLFACLIAVLEHLMIRAFAAWHAGNAAEADRAWAASGVAMVQATDLVNALTDLEAVPLASGAIPTDLPAMLGDVAVERNLMAAYARAAQAAAHEAEPALQSICRRIADYTRAVEIWRPEAPHPALAACTPVFRSFSATLRKFVQPAP